MTRGRTAVALVATLPALLTITRLTGWWPCSIACQGGGYYQRLGGIDVLWPALVAYAALAALAWRDAQKHTTWSAPTALLAGLLLGVSLFYASVAWRLGIVCPFCLSVHATVLVVAVALLPSAWRRVLPALLIGALAANAGFHHAVVRDVVADVSVPAQVVPPPAGSPAASAASVADRGRQRGRPDAPLLVEYGVSLQCPHCAAEHQPLLTALGPALAAGRIRLVLRPVMRPADPGSTWLASWALAAAARSPDAFDGFILAHLGTREGLTREQLLTLGGDLPALDATAAGGTFDALVTDDQRRLRRLGYAGVTPFIAVLRGDTVLARQSGDLDLPRLAALLDAPAAAATSATATPAVHSLSLSP